jgi:hypothetical protein
MLIGWGIGVAVGIGVDVVVGAGINVLVAFGISVGGIEVIVGDAICAAQAVKQREIIIKTNNIFFIIELLPFKKTAGCSLLPSPAVLIFNL